MIYNACFKFYFHWEKHEQNNKYICFIIWRHIAILWHLQFSLPVIFITPSCWVLRGLKPHCSLDDGDGQLHLCFLDGALVSHGTVILEIISYYQHHCNCTSISPLQVNLNYFRLWLPDFLFLDLKGILSSIQLYKSISLCLTFPFFA